MGKGGCGKQWGREDVPCLSRVPRGDSEVMALALPFKRLVGTQAGKVDAEPMGVLFVVCLFVCFAQWRGAPRWDSDVQPRVHCEAVVMWWTLTWSCGGQSPRGHVVDSAHARQWWTVPMRGSGQAVEECLCGAVVMWSRSAHAGQ